MRLPDPATFQRLKPVNRATTLHHFFENALQNESSVVKHLQQRMASYLSKPAINDSLRRVEWECKAKTEKKIGRYIMDSVTSVNDLTRECVRLSKGDAVCKQYHPLKFSPRSLESIRKISESTDFLLRRLIAYVYNQAKGLEDEEKAITATLRQDKDAKGQDDIPDGVSTMKIMEYKLAEKKCDELILNVYWFAKNVTEKQRQTYGVYPCFTKNT